MPIKEKSKSRKNSEKIEYKNFNLPRKSFKDEENEEKITQSKSKSNKYLSGKQFKYSTGKRKRKNR